MSRPRQSGKPIQEEKDGGHRYGNFHNYYNFNPAEERMKLLGETGGILDFVVDCYLASLSASAEQKLSLPNENPPAKKKAKTDSNASPVIAEFAYLDVGCNEGDLTMAVSEKVLSLLTSNRSSSGSEDPRIQLKARGLDLDQVLIKRANRKYASHIVQSTFRVSNVLEETLDERFYLTSIFSTTMWIHVHGGDDGLRRVLDDLCAHTTMFLLIEPQPSKCYRNAMVRLRKLGLPELDVSTDRLRLRTRIEQEVDCILQRNSFRRVTDFGVPTGDREEKDMAEKTNWHRSVRLYQRISEEPILKVCKKDGGC